ncbi:hypothetical protein GHT06_009635 [Daphnia sinensis]|uniref:C2H2-type domain-containing protein n=1 Tax=Daphnia sinensis TaxID=1820382 RepID=A0AAD5L5Y2_9CRUS|nr:hypothetical protein GHT06_009635 [Daphnia sinensis]
MESSADRSTDSDSGSERYFNHSAGGVGGGGGGGSAVIGNSLNGNGRLADCDDIDLPVRCEVCDKPFHDVDQVDSHLVSVHQFPLGRYPCTFCSRAFSCRPLLSRHAVVQHGLGRRYPCEHCAKVFSDPSNLQRHIRSSHVGARAHACPECGKTFATSSGLKQHTHIHSSVKPFQCEVCLKAYTQFSNLCRHKRMHADCRLQIRCQRCGQPFSTVTSLAKHRRFCDTATVAVTASSSTAGTSINHATYTTIHSNNNNNNNNSNSSSNGSGMVPPPPPPPLPLQPPHQLALGQQPMNLMHLYRPTPSMGLSQFNSSLLSTYAAGLSHHFSPAAAAAAVAAAANEPYPVMSGCLTTPAATSTPRHRHASEQDRSDESDIDVTDDRSSVASSSFASELGRSRRKRFRSSGDDGADGNETDSDRHSRRSDSSCSTNVGSCQSDRELNNDEKKTKESGEQPLDLSKSTKENERDNSKDSDQQSPLVDVDEHEEDPAPSRPPSSNKEAQCSSNSSAEEVKSDPAPPQIQAYPPPPSPSLLASIGNSLNQQQSGVTQPSGLAYPRPIHPALMLEAMNFHHRMMPDGRLPYASFLSGHHHHMMPTRCPPIFTPLLNGLGALSALNGSLRNNLDMIRRSGGHQHPVSPHLSLPKPFHHHDHHHHQHGEHMATVNGSGTSPGSSSSVMGVASSGMSKSRDRYSCKFCGKVFPRSANLTRHLRTHTGEQPYKCKYCDRSFSISSNLQRHVRNIHNKEKPFRCPLCERCFGQQTNLDRHLKKHEMDGNAGGADGGPNCSSVLSVSPEVTVSSPEGSASVADLMMMHQVASGTQLGSSATVRPETAVASSYFADIRKFMGQVTADSLLVAQFQHQHHQHGHSDDELSSQDSNGGDRNTSSTGPVRLEIAS